ncbi:pentapeptide repeat-containing protein [Aphanizomenon sp. PH219]|nr:pentapeptide repeat-containing protein [Aphanizomenon sp. PH219]
MNVSKDYAHQKLIGRNFSEINLTGVDLSYADLQGSNFAIARLQDANFTYANLKDVNLGETKPFKLAVISPDGRFIASVESDNKLRLWDVTTGYELFFSSEVSKNIETVVFSPDSKLLASNGINSSFYLWDVEKRNLLKTFEGHKASVKSLAFSPNGEILASGGGYNDEIVYLWEVKSGKQLKILTGHSKTVNNLAFSPDGKLLASSDSSYQQASICFWDVASGNLIQKLNQFSNSINSLAFDSNNQSLFVLTNNNLIKIDLIGNILPSIPGHTGYIKSVAFNPDGQLIISGSDDKTIRLWNVATGQEIKVFEGHIKPNCFKLLSQENKMAIASSDGQIEIWDLTENRKIKTDALHKESIKSLDYSSSTQSLISASSDKSLGSLNLKTENRSFIRQELHCLRANIFRVQGLRDSQKKLLLSKGAIEIDPAELPKTQNIQDIRSWLRTRRIQTLSSQIIKEQKKRNLPTILIIAPGTFLPLTESLRKEEISKYRELRWFRRFLSYGDFSYDKKNPNLRAIQEEFEHFYMMGMEDSSFWREFQDSSSEYLYEKQFRKESKQDFNVISSLRENYTALIELINKRFFDIVIDLDIFSQLNKNMFSSTVFEENFLNSEDFRESRYNISRGLRYVEKGQTIFFKLFSPEQSRKSSKNSKSSNIRYLLEEFFDGLRFDLESTNLILTGFSLTHFLPFDRWVRRNRGENFYWVIDESIREDGDMSEGTSVTYLDYPVGNFSDFFQDLYTEITISERTESSEFASLNINQLSYLSNNSDEEKRFKVAQEVISRIQSSKKHNYDEQFKLIQIIQSLQKDSALSVRQNLLQNILDNFDRLPVSITNLIKDFAKDDNDIIRANVAIWIITTYDQFGKTYESFIIDLVEDKSDFVRQRILDTIKTNLERLPLEIRQLTSRLIGSQVSVQIISGSGMLIDEESDLVLQVTNETNTVLDIADIEIQLSAEYTIISKNKVSLAGLQPGKSGIANFTLKMNDPKQITVNYKFNNELKSPPLFINAVRGNPYIYGSIIKEEIAFFGRKQELEEIIQDIMRPTRINTFLIGERRLGKSSLLFQVKQRLEKPFIPVYIVIYESSKTQEVLKVILDKIISSLVEKNILDNEWKNHQFSQSERFVDSLKKIIKQAKNRLPDIKIVWLLDEADYLLSIKSENTDLLSNLNSLLERFKEQHSIIEEVRKLVNSGGNEIDETVQNILRSALQELGDNIVAVVAGTSILSSYGAKYNSPFLNIFHRITLKMLTLEETRKLVTQPASCLGYSYSEDAINSIINLSGGQPYCCQALCYEAFEYAIKEQRRSIEISDIELAQKKVVNDLFDSYFLGFWDRSDTMQREFLKRLAQGKSIESIKIENSQIKELISWNLIRQEQNSYVFCSELNKLWVLMA